MTKLALTAALCVSAAIAGDWGAPVHVLHELKPCVTYRARVTGDYLVIHAALQPGWHTFTIDNERRAAEKLAGKPSIGIDQPTRLVVSDGLEVVGPWYQSAPKDFSKPQLRWFSFGFEDEATFAAKVRRSGSGDAKVAIRGQACTDKTCKNIDVTVAVPTPAGGDKAAAFDISPLVEVR